MRPTSVDLRVIVPGLFGPMDLSSVSDEHTPALDRLFARASGGITGARDPLESLAAPFGVAPRSCGDLPSASLCLLADAPDLDHSGCWFHADPVHLRADRDRLLVFSGPVLGVTQAESDALIESFNAHFADDGLRIEAPRPDRWYLHLAQCPDLRTRPLYGVIGGSMEAALPKGADAPGWVHWQNEAQMLFYSHPVNQSRERAGQLALSGVWSWGGGELPQVWDRPGLLVGDHPLAKGLASQVEGAIMGLDVLERPVEEWSAGIQGKVIVFWDRIWRPCLDGDADAWGESLRAFEALSQRLLSALKSGAVAALEIDDGAGVCLRMTRADLRCFWRRRGNMADWVKRVDL